MMLSTQCWCPVFGVETQRIVLEGHDFFVRAQVLINMAVFRMASLCNNKGEPLLPRTLLPISTVLCRGTLCHHPSHLLPLSAARSVAPQSLGRYIFL